MKRSSVLSRTFFRRPAVRELVPDLKLILAVLTVSSESHVGCWVPGGLGEDAGLDLTALEGGMVDLERRDFIFRDVATGEIFLRHFFRDNIFNGPLRGNQARADFSAVRSEKLRREILKAVENSPECGLSTTLLENQRLVA